MLADAAISAVHWTVFVVAILFFLALDLGVFHRRAHVVRLREALIWTAVWFATSMAFPLMIGLAEQSGEGAMAFPIVIMFFFSFGVLMLSMFLGTLLMFLGALPLPAATAHMLAHDRLGAAFRVDPANPTELR